MQVGADEEGPGAVRPELEGGIVGRAEEGGFGNIDRVPVEFRGPAAGGGKGEQRFAVLAGGEGLAIACVALGVSKQDFATLFLLAQNPGALLTTIRSRCVSFQLSPLPVGEIERELGQAHPEWKPRERELGRNQDAACTSGRSSAGVFATPGLRRCRAKAAAS